MAIKIGVLISGGGSNMAAIVNACLAGKIDGKVVFVGSDNPDAEGLEKAKSNKISTWTEDFGQIFSLANKTDNNVLLSEVGLGMNELKKIKADSIGIVPEYNLLDSVLFDFYILKRILAEQKMLKHFIPEDIDLLVLAGFMRNLTSFFIDRINTDPMKPRIMNIHPALLPAFPGTDGYGDTFHYGCRAGGCTVHFVDYGEDTGPIIGQAAFGIMPNMSLDEVKKEGLRWEWDLYSRCIQLFAEGRLRIEEVKQRNGNMRKVVKILPKGGA